MLSPRLLCGLLLVSALHVSALHGALAAEPPPRLLVTLRDAPAAASGARVDSSRGASGDGTQQTVQAIDGQPATFHVGQSVPVRTQSVTGIGPGGAIVRETHAYRDVGTGFRVVPRVSGDAVMIEVFAIDEREVDATGAPLPAGVPGDARERRIASRRIATTVRGRLGEWIDVAASGAEPARSGARVESSRDASRVERRFQLKVDRLEAGR